MQSKVETIAVQFVNGYADKLPADIKDEIISLMKKAMYNDEADMCALHVYESNREELHIAAQAGLSPAYLAHFKDTHPFDTTASGRAIGIGSAIIISDVLDDVNTLNNRSRDNEAGVRAIKAVPLFWHQKKVGVIATHFREPKYTWNLNHLDEVVRPLSEVLAGAARYIH
jgi:GAF domain-containing protein